MILISHRGNINGPIKSLENNPIYLDSAIKQGYNVELDIWYINNEFWLGHDVPKYATDISWLTQRVKFLWIHCKDMTSVNYFLKNKNPLFNFFWHQKDDIALTSLNFIWAYPGQQPISGSIAVTPEIYNDSLSGCIGVCSDYIGKYNYDKNNYI